jgi:tellurite resistance protein TehA-like permease
MAANTPTPTLSSTVAGLHPASFAMVMATGIVSVAAQLQGFPRIAQSMLVLNVVLYAVLWILTAIRITTYTKNVYADVLDHNRCVGFFTLVAGTCVLGNEFVVVVNRPQIAIALWYFGIGLWAFITYTIFTVLTVKKDKPDLNNGINGAWLVAVVAAQSISVLGGLVAPQYSEGRDVVLFFALVMWLGGGMLYIWIIALIFYRYTFLSLDPRQLAPPYWINMGAMAISTLAGVVLISQAADSHLLTELLPFLKGLSLLFWATATWWIPLLVLLGIWRHILRKVPLNYDVVYWSAVFPLGMYAACTHRLVDTMGQTFLTSIPKYFFIIALCAWAATFLGLLTRCVRVVGQRFRPLPETTQP